MSSALVIAIQPEIIAEIQAALEPDVTVRFTDSIEKARPLLPLQRYDIILIDLVILMQTAKVEEYEIFFQSFKELCPMVEIIVMAPPQMLREAIRAVKRGARKYMTYPVVRDEVKMVFESIHAAIIRQSELDYLRDQFWRRDAADVVYTRSPKMLDVFRKIRSVAPTKTTVLLMGETGTGKGVLARLIHQHSRREKAQFISVHCGAIPDTLIESELFGHEKGAFTGAIRRKLGKFEIARGGTIFLDEIGTITPAAQIKLLQVLQDGSFSHVGGDDVIQTNARVIAATNSDLKAMTDDGRFRKDLFYRLNVFPIEVPTLRERAEDLPAFIETFLKNLNISHQKGITGIKPQVIEALKLYAWPGNIRELENLIERAYILETTSELTSDSFPGELFAREPSMTVLTMDDNLPLADARKLVIEDFERQYLKNLLTKNKGRIKKSSQEAGVSTRQLHKLLTKYGIRKEAFK
jgi:DNA-binding NtrC family response regulator